MTDATDNDATEKAAYAALLLKERDPFKAALLLFPNNTNRALRVANEWPNDPVVKAEQTKLTEGDGELSFLPGKAQLARDIWDRMQGTTLAGGVVIPPTPEEYAKLAKLYADVRGFIDKPQTNVNVNNTVVQRVVEVPVFQSSEEWEAAAARQQRELLNNARTRH